MSTHDNLNNFKKWVNIDINDTSIKHTINKLIEEDSQLESPKIIERINGRYSPFRKHISNLGNAQLDLLKNDKKFISTAYVALAAIKFKKKLSNSNK